MRATPEVRAENEETALQQEGVDSYRIPLPPHPIAAEQARILTTIALTHWNILDIADNALIISSELVTNAVKLGDVFHLSLVRQGRALLVEVHDHSEAAPDRRRRSVDRVDGRGLLLVEACAKDWGWRLEEEGGKTVWALVGEPETA